MNILSPPEKSQLRRHLYALPGEYVTSRSELPMHVGPVFSVFVTSVYRQYMYVE